VAGEIPSVSAPQSDLKKARGTRGVSSAIIDRLPPHNSEMEMGVLGCCLLDPANVKTCFHELKYDGKFAFFDLRHQTVYAALLEMFLDGKPIDLITVSQHLKDRKLLNEVGGIAYLSQLQDAPPSAANLPYYLGVVKEKSSLRKLIQTCTGIVGRIYNHQGDVETLRDEIEQDLQGAFDAKENGGEYAIWEDLISFDAANDTNNIIGRRWLCRGYAAWLIGPSGVGKSSLLLQFGVSFAAGLPICGITPVRPLRVLVVQAENDKGDLSEMARGIERGLHLEGNELIRKNIRIRSVIGKVGQQFCAWLRTEIQDFRAELVLVDPLLSFAGIDVSRQDQASTFCRVWMNPVLAETGAAMIAAHHTGKPQRESKNLVPQTLNEKAYAGIGSSELVNWARAVMLLEDAGNNAFRLWFSKRGQRAGACHPSGEPATMIWLRHAQDGSIFWEQSEPIEHEEKTEFKNGRPSKVDELLAIGLGSLLDTLTTPLGKNELARKIESYAAQHKFDTNRSTCIRVIEKLVSNNALSKTEKGYQKA
jgi:hypothetical protein